MDRPILIHLFFFDTLEAFLGGIDTSLVCLGGAAEVEALFAALLLLVESIVHEGLQDEVTLVVILQARLHIAAVEFDAWVMCDRHLLTSFSVGLRLQPQLQLAQVGGGGRDAPVPRSRG